MSDKKNNVLKSLEPLIDELSEDLFEMTDKEYLEFKNSQEQIRADASEVRDILHQADKLFRKETLRVARESYEKEKVVESSYKNKIKKHIKSARVLLEKTLYNNSNLLDGLTFQNRNIKDFTDEDIEIAVSQLLELSLIDNSSIDKINNE